MPDAADQTPWDFLTFVEGWNLYGLPLLLALAVALVVSRTDTAALLSSASPSIRTVRRLGLIHYLMSLGFLLVIGQELLAINDVRNYFANASIFALILSYYVPGVAATVYALLGFGLRRLNRVARLVAILWSVLCSSLAIVSMFWMVHYQPAVDLARWPDLFVAKLVPITVCVILFLPRIKKTFISRSTPVVDQLQSPAAVQPQRDAATDRAVSLITLTCLLILVSTLTIDTIDWVIRLVVPSELDAPLRS